MLKTTLVMAMVVVMMAVIVAEQNSQHNVANRISLESDNLVLKHEPMYLYHSRQKNLRFSFVLNLHLLEYNHADNDLFL